MLYKVVRHVAKHKLPKNVLSDETIRLTGVRTAKSNPETRRRIRAKVEVDGKGREMVFLTNSFEWSAATVVELCRARWQVELLKRRSDGKNELTFGRWGERIGKCCRRNEEDGPTAAGGAGKAPG